MAFPVQQIFIRSSLHEQYESGENSMGFRSGLIKIIGTYYRPGIVLNAVPILTYIILSTACEVRELMQKDAHFVLICIDKKTEVQWVK